MGVPNVLNDIKYLEDNAVFATDEEVTDIDTMPIDADTLKGHPLEYFASKEYVSEVLSNYISSVLNTTY